MKNYFIRLLPDSVANQIAAGEVIQRPASVVKELVENAVDAGATVIKVILRDAGRTLIQVVDNGCGMSETDARLAFERHSTSKIKAAADLFDLHTMGFRGEALASIAAVAQVELRTRRAEDEVGTCLTISGSKVESQEPDGCAAGSNMMVKNLFFNVPARRKFLKKDAVELSNIMHEFERLALVNPGIELTIIHNDNILHQLMPGSLKQRIGQLFGKSVEHQLLPVETATSLVTINGFVGRPDGARKRNSLQYFFVNGRNMLHPYFRKAVLNCYENLIGPDVQPNYFINFTVDPSTIDVNIHPTKNEIKFENEQSIWQILEAAVRESLGKFNVAPAMDFSMDDIPEIPVFAPNATPTLDLGMSTDYNPFTQQEAPRQALQHNMSTIPSRSVAFNHRQEKQSASFSDWDKLYSRWNNEGEVAPELRMTSIQIDEEPQSKELFDGEGETAVETPSVMQFKGKYIFSPARSGLMIIDQHRAHVKVLYESILKTLSSTSVPTQNLIFPEMVTLTPGQEVFMDSVVDQLSEMGFDLASLGGGSWSINGVPAVAGDGNPAEMLMSIVSGLEDSDDSAEADLKGRVALSIAKSQAIRRGQIMTPEEMEKLMSDLFALPTPTYTPEGHLIVKIVDTDTLLRAF
ncbi:MAG: DNA mismatch repair endonuclease MutL [Muribaculaceae bacterium]|nr:DNA mismatch repair endonuclease MutL [Muribaculaceae bacterium]